MNRTGEKESTNFRNGSSLKLIIIFIAVAFSIGILSGWFIKGCWVNGNGHHHESINNEEPAIETKVSVWTCSMHPQIKQDGPGQCPICGMDLISLKSDDRDGKADLHLGERAKHLASIETSPVEYRNLTKSIYTVGKINYDESSVAHVTSWVGGRIDKLYVNFTGTHVQKGEHLVYIYSPELIASQEEYLIVYKGGQSGLTNSNHGLDSIVKNARDRLLLWGITEEQIKELEQTREVSTYLTIYAPAGGTVINKNIFEGMYVKTGDRLFTIADLNRVWLYLDIYEYDIPWIRYGQDVIVTTESFPGVTFHGTVVFIDPFLDDKKRTVQVRVNMDNLNGKLKPGMYANASIKVTFGSDGVILNPDIEGKYMCPMHPDIISDKKIDCPECGMALELVGKNLQWNNDDTANISSENEFQDTDKINKGVLAIPHSSVLYTGLRNIVYVENEKGNYELRNVTLGPKADGYYHVISGLKHGERVVTNGSFLIDSQMQLLGKPSLLFYDDSQPDSNKRQDVTKTDSKEATQSSLAKIMDEFITAYFSIRTKLAGDSIEDINNDIDLMERKIAGIKEESSSLAEDTGSRLMKQINHLGHLIKDLKGKGLNGTRESFKSLSMEMIKYVNEFHSKIIDTRKAYTFFCPMANGRWLQESDKIGNPYHGSEMFRCGILEHETP